MRARSFRGRTMEEALAALRRELGPDALILGTRRLAGEGGLEITAAAEGGAERASPAAGLGELGEEIARLKALVWCLLPRAGRGGELEELIRHGVAADALARFAERAGETPAAALASLVETGGDLEAAARGARLAFIGPSGAGKSTALVKLTVRLLRREALKIGWVTLDHQSLTGAAELRVYAQILGVACEAAEDEPTLAEALGRLADRDVVLVDTPGVSPRDGAALAEIARLAGSVAGLRRALVLSAATHPEELLEWIELYRQVGFDSLIFTKLDECRRLGGLLSGAICARRPLAYLSSGPGVADGFAPARAETLAAWVWKPGAARAAEERA